jgi:hypothetical protein
MSDWATTQKSGHVHITNGMSQYGANHSADIHIDGRDMASISQKEMRSWLGGLDITKHRSRHRKSARCKITNMKQYGYQNIHFFIHIESNRVRLYRSPV